ncbi:hypothetical protein COCCADRAFT_25812 [Bipolaris zeicola 26-R-13]|uniref:Uncharacterized protein n=1 Tax=Cochliobolus carbonum (strain 26-R-13) TaxID=930089 RepID=W6YEK3_COCC2|nr:uncharacterized protein COCCADRAFT_25812 [Bipolaris zeicola 26-R-13]EUC33934.1 hypothetical protein COCCADRAFT_25812 [Bipolaris zeicola 26-R-13]
MRAEAPPRTGGVISCPVQRGAREGRGQRKLPPRRCLGADKMRHDPWELRQNGRGEAGGPIGAGEIQMMRHMQPSGHPQPTQPTRPTRPSEASLPLHRCTDERLQGGRPPPPNHAHGYRHGAAEKPWGRPIFPCTTRRRGRRYTTVSTHDQLCQPSATPRQTL